MELTTAEKAACYDALVAKLTGKGRTTGYREPRYEWVITSTVPTLKGALRAMVLKPLQSPSVCKLKPRYRLRVIMTGIGGEI